MCAFDAKSRMRRSFLGPLAVALPLCLAIRTLIVAVEPFITSVLTTLINAVWKQLRYFAAFREYVSPFHESSLFPTFPVTALQLVMTLFIGAIALSFAFWLYPRLPGSKV